MLGEHGLWYKKCFFEDACRVPLIISHPRLAARRVAANVSLLDLLPTLLEIAGDDAGASLVDAIDGNSLWGLASAADTGWNHPVFAENLAEGANAPLLMAKQDQIKYIYSAVDPHQLFDLAVDPLEQTNQIDNPAYREVRDVLCGLIERRWDYQQLTRDILASQRRRRFLRATLAKGQAQAWDYRPVDELERHCLRADQVYSQWAYQNILDYRFPEE
jgi:choline-sulfatase